LCYFSVLGAGPPLFPVHGYLVWTKFLEPFCWVISQICSWDWRFLYSYERHCLLERFWNILLCLSSFISACNIAWTLLFTWIKWNLDKEPTVFNWQIVTAADVALTAL
jgi:hypothetical protein